MIFALVGNQNSGKTTLFNQLTGANQHVGNFPGVTVEQKVGQLRSMKSISVVDLPGLYSLRPYSTEETVTLDFILNNKPDLLINIVDATNLVRNLYLTLQLIELNIPMVLALNMMDELQSSGGSVDILKLSEGLGLPVVPISAAKNDGVRELIARMVETAKQKNHPARMDFCPPGPIHRTIHAISILIEDHAERAGLSPRFAATKVIEEDERVLERLKLSENEREMIEHSITEMEQEYGLDRYAAMAEMRYTFIEDVTQNAVNRPGESRESLRTSKIDRILMNKLFAIPIFILAILATFWATFQVIGTFLSDLLAAGISLLSNWMDNALIAYGLNPVIQSLIIDGVFAGVGAVLSFLPIIVTLFFFLSIFEDTGYMARVAYMMDKPMRSIGLSGRSIVPLLIGFGCTVPAVMATRTLSSDRDRKMTMLLTPFMSCSAKIPIYAVFASAFFTRHQGMVMTGLYLFGILMALLLAFLTNQTVLRGKPVPFVMELPNYRLPSLKSVGLLVWDKAKDFLQRAFTVIFLATVLIWFLQSFDSRLNVVSDNAESLLAAIGKWITPIFRPLGFQDWRIPTALITGLTAKEAVVSTLSVLTATDVSALNTTLSKMFTLPSALSFLTFTLLYTPCVAAITTLKREMGSLAYAGLILFAQTGFAWLVAYIAFKIWTVVL